jgi:hypothetical protein
MSFGIFGKKEDRKRVASSAVEPIKKVAPATRTAAVATLKVGMDIRGADKVPVSYEVVNKYFRGSVVSLEPNDMVRVKMDGTRRIFKVDREYVVPR